MIGTRTRRAVPRNPLYRAVEKVTRSMASHVPARAAVERLEGRVLLASTDPIISEFMADNTTGLVDGNGKRGDWIEIYNPASTAVDLAGWHLTDTASNVGEYTFPSFVVPAGGYKVVFATGETTPFVDAAGYPHTNFALAKGGEYLALAKPDGTITSDYGPQFPPQTSNVSYGVGPGGTSANTLLDSPATGRSLTPTTSIGTGWTGPGFNDSTWTAAGTGIGFEANGLAVPSFTAETEPNNDLAGANNAVTSFTAYTGNLYQLGFTGTTSASGDVDYIKIGAMQAGDVISVTASGRTTTPLADPLIELYRGSNAGTLVTSDDNNGPGNESLIQRFSINTADTYYLRIRAGGAGTGTGGYRVGVRLENTSTAPGTASTVTAEHEGNDTLATATDLSNAWRAVNYQHHIGGGTNFGSSHDWFKYQFNAGDEVSVVLHSTSTTDGSIVLRDAQGNALATEDGSSTPGGAADLDSYVYSYVIPATGVYYVDTVKTANSPTGAYTLDVYLSTQTPPPHPANLTGQYQTSLQADMYFKNASNYLRMPFSAPDPSSVSALTLRMKYEDGFVAYLNGVEVARRNAPGAAGTPLAYNAAASTDRAASLATTFENIDLSAFRNLLVTGNNVLAIQGLNSSASSDDFLIVPQITARVTTTGTKQFFYTATPGQPNIPGAGVVINEIHYNPDVKTTPVEFVELFNNSNQTIGVGGWQFTKGISYTFPAGASMAPGQYVVLAENAAAFQAKFGFAPFGQYSGGLSNDGEMVRLTDAGLNVIDEVSYGAGFPWPTVGDPLTTDGTGASIQLINAGLDNDLGGDWRSALPTPGAQNSDFNGNAAPAIRQVANGPSMPTSNQPVTITAKVTDPDGVSSVSLLYQVNAPGQYVPSMLVNTSNWTNSHNPAYDQNWVTLAMYDDGTHGDATPGDGVYSAQVPGPVNQNRTLVRYKVSATDVLGASITGPYADDPQLNFAYFVYDGVPGWSGTAQPGVTPVTNFSAADMSRLQVYQLIARNQDVIDAQHIPPSTAPAYPGNVELWRGAFYYNGIVYDNVGFRTRGGTAWRYAMGKNKFQLHFNRNHGLQAYDNYGRPYKTKWDSFTLNAIIQQGNYWHRGEQGMFEAMNLKLWQLAGVPANNTNWVQLRVVDGAAESTTDQYTGDLWGMYLAMEQNDGNFLDEHGLPDGNYYRMNPEDGGAGGGTLNNQGATQPSDNSDLVNFVNTYKNTTTPPTDDWWRQNVNLDEYYAYRTIVEAVHHYDIDQSAGKNWFYYHNPVTNLWEMHPWDSDLTWANNMYGGGDDPFKSRVLPRAAFNLDYKNKIREVRDLLFNTDQTYSLLEEMSNIIDPPGVVNAPVDWDRDMWDYNPIMLGYTYGDKGGQGRYYAGGPAGSGVVIPAPGGFQGMVQKMRNYVVERAAYLDTLDADSAIPNKPALAYTGTAGFPVDQLSFHSSNYTSPVGASFASMRWRIAEVYDPNNPTYSPTAPRPYEITATWESPELTSFNPDMSSIPANKLLPGHTYRVRVEFKDSTGRWSNWSDPVQFVAAQPAGPITALRVTEMMYHPAAPPAGSPYTADDFEYVELLNTSDANLDLSGVKFTSGIDFTFPDAFILAPGQRALVVSNLAAFQSRYGTGLNAQIAGAFANGTHLSDSGERIRLAGPSDQTIVDFSYSDNWYPQTDGDGFSLVVINPTADPTTLSDASSWRASQNPNGAPGDADPGFNPDDVVVNELLANPGTGRAFVEIRNTTGSTVDLSNWFLSDSTDNLKKYQFAAGTTIAAGGLLTLYADTAFGLGASAFALSPMGGAVYLTSADATGTLLGFRTNQSYDASDPGVSLGRYVKSTGGKDFTALTSATPGAANAQPLVGPVVITEVMYNPPAGGNEYVELRNTTGRPIDISGWQMGGVTFTFPQGTVIPAHGYFLVVPIDPTLFRSTYNVPAATQVFGPFAGLLDDGGERVEIRKPGAPVNGVTPYVSVDGVNYGPTFPWPTSPDGAGASLGRISQQGYGNDVANWAPSTAIGGTPGRPNAASTAVASYNATSALGKISVTFAEDVSGTLGAGALSLQNRSGGTTPASSYAWDPTTLTATWTFTQVPADGNYRATLSAAGINDWSGVTIDGDGDGQAGGDVTLDFFFLNGDANGDRVVNFSDLLSLAKNYNKSGMTLAQGDFNGDGLVNFSDLLTLAKNYNKSLPAGGEPVPAAGATVDFSAAFAVAQAAAAASTTTTTPAPTTIATPPPPTVTSKTPLPVKLSPPLTPKPAPKPKPTPPVSPPPVKKPALVAVKRSVPDLPPSKPKAPARPATFSKAKIR